jgi:hypothetical protein
MGPILYAIFVSFLFDQISLSKFSCDNFVLKFNHKVNASIVEQQMKLRMIKKWLKDSGLKDNESKTVLG